MIQLLFVILILITSVSLLKDVFGWASFTSSPKSATCPTCQNKMKKTGGTWTCSSCQSTLYKNKVSASHTQPLARVTKEMRLVVELFAKMTKSDGIVTKQEILVVDRLLKSTYQPSDRQLAELRRLFNLAKQTPDGYPSILQQLHLVLPKSESERIQLIDHLFQIALADNPIDDRQNAIISHAADVLKVSTPFKQIRARYIPEITRHFILLGCSESDSIETIKKNYRRLIKEYHPDRHLHKQSSPDFIQKANQKIKDIHQAYEAITQYKQAGRV
ncbi:TerB family tellurite resistance protein [Pullulanibacillus sp. KACC 23026]|uniref:TerB family tellurite resistance protein n=1 Tax=Pullulanibacillus sp. KACC 23026 TaxID=3028315 RepID=UPI0023B1D0C0|nr:TerB family tellurite resistance protein [Pullulanibacillus sp. KACC 23026]WEG13160.1 TerB family tellurite resistance protein [Pullulanibacillus sp. KACC 23026]